MKTIKTVLGWNDDDIRNVLGCEPDLECDLPREAAEGITVYHTPNGKLVVGNGIGEYGASFDSEVVRFYDD